MSIAKEKVSYLRGLFDGLDIDKKDEQGKMFAAIIDAIDSLADGIEDNEATIDELDECVSDLYDSLEELEEDFYGFLGELDDIEDALDEDDFIEVQCPHCDYITYFDQETLGSRDDIICPFCNKPIIPLEDEEESD